MSADEPIIRPTKAERRALAAAEALKAQQPRRLFVSKRTYQGMHPRPKKVPVTAEDGAALRAAELRRRSKAAKRARAHHKPTLLPSAPAEPSAAAEAAASPAMEDPCATS